MSTSIASLVMTSACIIAERDHEIGLDSDCADSRDLHCLYLGRVHFPKRQIYLRSQCQSLLAVSRHESSKMMDAAANWNGHGPARDFCYRVCPLRLRKQRCRLRRSQYCAMATLVVCDAGSHPPGTAIPTGVLQAQELLQSQIVGGVTQGHG